MSAHKSARRCNAENLYFTVCLFVVFYNHLVSQDRQLLVEKNQQNVMQCCPHGDF